MGRGATAYQVIRVILAGIGLLCFVGGLALIAAGGASATVGIWVLLGGGVILVAIVLERTRYRSEAAERTAEPSGPGGGETGPLAARFERTTERFIDPTTGQAMRVFVDPRTGERRYLAEQ
jgi:hypothetical protein